MENRLEFWVESSELMKEFAEKEIKHALLRDYCIDEHNLKEDEQGFTFLFDDETHGNARIEFEENKGHLGIKILADHSWECIPIYEMALACFPDGEV